MARLSAIDLDVKWNHGPDQGEFHQMVTRQNLTGLAGRHGKNCARKRGSASTCPSPFIGWCTINSETAVLTKGECAGEQQTLPVAQAEPLGDRGCVSANRRRIVDETGQMATDVMGYYNFWTNNRREEVFPATTAKGLVQGRYRNLPRTGGTPGSENILLLLKAGQVVIPRTDHRLQCSLCKGQTHHSDDWIRTTTEPVAHIGYDTDLPLIWMLVERQRTTRN